MSDGSSSLYLDIYHQGKRKYEFLNIHLSNKRKFAEQDKVKRELAEKIRIKRDNELLVQKSVSFEKKTGQDNILLALDKLISEKNSMSFAWSAVKKHLIIFSGKKTKLCFDQISEQWILDFQSYLLKKISINTAFNYLAYLNFLFKTATRNKIIKSNPFGHIPKNLRIKKQRENQRVFLMLHEIEKLAKTEVEKNKEEYKRIFLFCCFTGLRWSDANCLKWNSIMSINNNGRQEKAIHFRQEKTENIQSLPLSKQAIEILELQGNNGSEFVFSKIYKSVVVQGSKGALVNMNKFLSGWTEKAKIKKHVTFHASRHTFATLALTYGAGLYTVSKLLGHQSVITTTIYAKVVDELKINAVAKLPNLNTINL